MAIGNINTKQFIFPPSMRSNYIDLLESWELNIILVFRSVFFFNSKLVKTNESCSVMLLREGMVYYNKHSINIEFK